jgi:hypothetical protein
MREEKDNSAKWLIEHHGDAIVRIGGISGFTAWRAAHAERAHPRQLPDGLLQVTFPGRSDPDLFVIEVSTYSERRAEEQAARDAALVWLDRRVVPEVITLVLHPRGDFRLSGQWQQASRHGTTQLACGWRVIEMWVLSAEQLLATDDVGVIPWVPLAQTSMPVEALLQQCHERIERQAPPEEQRNLIAVTQVMTLLRYNDLSLLAIIGGRQMMIESPLIQELVAEEAGKRICTSLHTGIATLLQARLGPVPADVDARLRAIQDEPVLQHLIVQAGTCPDFDAFRAQLPS